MKKLFTLGLMALVLMLFASMQVYSGPGCGAKASADKPACTSSKGTAQLTASTNAMSPEECAKLCGMTPEECAKMCGGKDNCSFTQISVKGMTCAGCEGSIKSALTDVPGVFKVIKVDHKEGMALVCTDQKVCDQAKLTKAIADKGYTAEIIPAVAKTVDAKTGKVGCAATCGKSAAGCVKSKVGCAGTKGTKGTETGGLQ